MSPSCKGKFEKMQQTKSDPWKHCTVCSHCPTYLSQATTPLFHLFPWPMAHKKHLALDVWHNNCYGSIKPTPVQSDTIVLHSYVSYFKAKEMDYTLNTYAMTVTPFGVSRGYSTRPALALNPSIGLVCKRLPNSVYSCQCQPFSFCLSALCDLCL